MLDQTLRTQLQTHLAKLVHPIVLRASLDDGSASQELWALLNELDALSDKISLQRTDDNARRPSFAIVRPNTDIRVDFAAIPLGHEFTSLVLALLHVGGHPPRLSDDLIDQIKGLSGDFHFETFMSLSCQSCPDTIQALNMMSVLNPRIHHTAIDGALFQSEVEARDIMSVPTVWLNGQLFDAGRLSVEQILAKLDTNASAQQAQRLEDQPPYDMLIVGGGPAGAAAALYAARKGIRTGIVAERFGGQVQDTMGIDNLPSVLHTEGPKLAASLEEHVRQYGVDIMDGQRVEALHPAIDPNGLLGLQLANGALLHARTVVLAPGARWRQMNVPGEDEYRNRGVAYCPHCDGPLFKGKRVAVIGGGNSGVEAAIDLAGLVAHVTLIEYDTTLRADAVLQTKLQSLPNATVLCHTQTTDVLGDGKRVTGLVVRNRATSDIDTIGLDGVFVQIGLLPNTEWLKDTVDITTRGEIVVDDRGHTSLPGVFAAGDATTTPHKQIVVAMGDGATAALGAFDHLIRHDGPPRDTL